jgi:hypothetical protein
VTPEELVAVVEALPGVQVDTSWLCETGEVDPSKVFVAVQLDMVSIGDEFALPIYRRPDAHAARVVAVGALDGEPAGTSAVNAHVFGLERDERGRTRWVCSCGDVGRYRARRPYLAWRGRRCGRVALRATKRGA